MIETVDRLAVFQGSKVFKQRFGFPICKVIETIDRLGLIQAREIVQTTVKFSNLESDLNYGYIGCKPRPRTC